ncbi:lytic transglycosylase domain-containing protein [Nocardia camponoti]|uniref:Transglycosylase SLT domain-containing protein n=1 Tax=Nocardia camponoti TaxID=1616106 RepID=A0A917QEU0_9NOCA|nr:lytic murein transglycosylase [Nocardia camponoti]GGK47418.1 hypothetical protein GCM10011591_18420 [Nocardia camponoti]
MSALVVAGLVASGSAVQTNTRNEAPAAPELLAAATAPVVEPGETDPADIVGLLPVSQESPRKLRAVNPGSRTPSSGIPVPQSISLPAGSGALGIPEIVLAAYRNAELAMESAEPGCGITWNLLAGIGRIESGHASNGSTDSAGTSTTPIFGPALDGTLPGNEVIKEADGGFVRAVGPMQFLPSTWVHYAADGNGDGHADPHNVFDASLAAAKYLCSGGMNLRDSAQELRAILRYNNSMSYAANVLSWSVAYRTGGAPSSVPISPGLVTPGSAPTVSPNILAAQGNSPATTVPTTTVPAAPKTTTPTPVMINLPGLPPIPCGIFCPAPAPTPPTTCVADPVPASMPDPLAPTRPAPKPLAQTYGAVAPKDPAATDPAQVVDPAQAANPVQPVDPAAKPACVDAPAPANTPAAETPQPTKTPEPSVTPTEEPAPVEEAPAPTPTPQPGITLPFNIVIPLPPVPAPL